MQGHSTAFRAVARFFMALFTSYLIIAYPLAACADDFMETPVSIVPEPNAPIAITKCKLGQGWGQQFADVTNRTHHSLLSATFRFDYFDSDGAKIGTVDTSLNIDPPLTGGDNQLLQSVAYASLSESANAIARMTCRVQAAAFTGLKKWAFGETWPERLSPLPEQHASQGTDRSTAIAPQTTSRNIESNGGLKLSVSNAWNDTLGGNLLVHAALDVQGGNIEMALRPQMITLVMNLANNEKKSYEALSQPAPTYQKFNPLGNTTQTAFEVDPKEDLGRLGAVTVPAHGTAHVIATFLVGADQVADPSDNRRVAIR